MKSLYIILLIISNMCNNMNLDIFLQSILVCCLLALYSTRSLFFLLLNSIIFLFFITVYGWFLELDIFISFLLVLDLGLFLVFFTMLIYLTYLFRAFNSFYTPANLFFYIIFFYFVSSEWNQNKNTFWFYNIIFYNWYFFFSSKFNSDLQILFECYFNLISFEFLLINGYIYLIILFSALILKVIGNFCYKDLSFDNYNFYNFFNILKRQNLTKQIFQQAVIRCWSKKS